MICAGIRDLRTYGVTTGELQAWIKRIRDIGFPGFDIKNCKEETK